MDTTLRCFHPTQEGYVGNFPNHFFLEFGDTQSQYEQMDQFGR